MNFTSDQLVAMIAGTSFAAGLNVYATVATLGLLARAGVITLPPAVDTLQSWWIIGVALALFGLEFFADKIPAFDLIRKPPDLHPHSGCDAASRWGWILFCSDAKPPLQTNGRPRCWRVGDKSPSR